MTELFDHRQVRRSFSRAAQHYDSAAALQREVGARLSESLDYYDDASRNAPVPQVIVDLGCGPGHAAAAMQKRWPKAQVIALDLAMGMLRQTRTNTAGPLPAFLDFARRPEPVCADVARLPLRDASVDILYSNLCLQWLDDLPAVAAAGARNGWACAANCASST